MSVEGFEKALQTAIYRVRALLALATKARTRSHTGETERVVEELTGLAESILRNFPVVESPP
jgi:hypothetical protein